MKSDDHEQAGDDGHQHALSFRSRARQPDLRQSGHHHRHEFTRQMLLSNSLAMPLYKNYLNGLPAQIDDLKKQLATESDATTQASLERQISSAENNLASQRELKPTPPNVTLTDHLTLYRGNREIQIRYLGRGHTAGDVVVSCAREGRHDGRLPHGRTVET